MAQSTANRTLGNLQSGARLALVGIIVNSLLAVVKIGAGWLGNSYVLIADGIESALDIAGSAIIWSGLKLAAKPPDDTHPYGHGKAEPIAAMVVAIAVLVAAFALAVQSLREIFTPHHAPAPFTLVVLVAVILVKLALYAPVARAGARAQSTAIKTDAGHHISDVITSAAAFIGISIALIGGRGYESADAWAALAACAMIAFNGFRLFLPALEEVMDSAPPKHFEGGVREIACAVPGVEQIEQCRVRKMGVAYYVDLHVGVFGDISVREGHRIAHQVKDSVRASNAAIVDVLVHIEPAP